MRETKLHAWEGEGDVLGRCFGLVSSDEGWEPSGLRGGGEGRAQNGIERIFPPWVSKNGPPSQVEPCVEVQWVQGKVEKLISIVFSFVLFVACHDWVADYVVSTEGAARGSMNILQWIFWDDQGHNSLLSCLPSTPVYNLLPPLSLPCLHVLGGDSMYLCLNIREGTPVGDEMMLCYSPRGVVYIRTTTFHFRKKKNRKWLHFSRMTETVFLFWFQVIKFIYSDNCYSLPIFDLLYPPSV